MLNNINRLLSRKNKSVCVSILFSVITLLLLTPAVSSAALLDIELNPRVPGPYQEVTAEVKGAVFDLKTAHIYWYLNEEIKADGVGETSFSFTTGSIDEDSVIDVVVVTLDGKRLDKSKTITPIEVDILWEADTYTPPFYKGKALPTYKSDIKLVAIPNSRKVAAHELMFTWKQDRFSINKNASGYGKNSFIIQGDIPPTPEFVGVEIESLNGTYTASKQISVTTVDPDIVLYKNEPLTGISYQNALVKRMQTNKQSVTIRMEPFYFSNDDYLLTRLAYKWLADNKEISNSTVNNRDIVLSIPTTRKYSTIQAIVSNTVKWIQEAQNTLSIEYKAE